MINVSVWLERQPLYQHLVWLVVSLSHLVYVGHSFHSLVIICSWFHHGCVSIHLWKGKKSCVIYFCNWNIHCTCKSYYLHWLSCCEIDGIMYIFSAIEPKAQVHYCDHALFMSLTFQILDFSEPAEQNLRKLYRKQDLNIIYQVCVFGADHKTKMAALAYDWQRHFQLLLCNGWMEFNKTLQESSSQHQFVLFFFGPIIISMCFIPKKRHSHAKLWASYYFLTYHYGSVIEINNEIILLSDNKS